MMANYLLDIVILLLFVIGIELRPAQRLRYCSRKAASSA